jgi:cytoskeletal protein RodZ
MEAEDIALATRVRPDFIAAIEALDLEALPARPFAIGYVRAYARALGLDPDAVVARFRADVPREDMALPTPIGDDVRPRHRYGGRMLATAGLVAAVLAWNVLVHVRARPNHAPPPAARLAIPAPTGPVVLGPPLPAPPEATTPPPYETPGLAKAVGEVGPASGPGDPSAPADLVPAGAPFIAHGQVLGAPAGSSAVVLQAVHPASLVVRGPGGAVYFARQLAAGQAWRAPDIAGLSVDVDVPRAMEFYVQGVAAGAVPPGPTSLASLTAAPAH